MTAPAAASTDASGKRTYIVAGMGMPSAGEVLKIMHKEGLIRWKQAGIAQEIASSEALQREALEGSPYRAVKLAEDRMPNDAAELGTAVHAAVEWHFTQSPDAYQIAFVDYEDPPLVQRHLDAFIICAEAFSITPVYVEQSVAHMVMGYAGTADLFALLDDPEHLCDLIHVCDAKSGKAHPEAGMQMAAYGHATHLVAYNQMTDQNELVGELEGICHQRCYILHAHEDSCRVLPVDMGPCWGAFVDARNLSVWEEVKKSIVGKPLKAPATLALW